MPHVKYFTWSLHCAHNGVSVTEKYYCTNVDVKIYGYFDIYKPSLSDYANLVIFYKGFHNNLKVSNDKILFCMS